MLLFLAIFTALIWAGSCDTEWGCSFQDNKYAIVRTDNLYSPVWGSSISPMLFESVEEVQKFVVKLEEIRTDIINKYTFNDVPSLFKLYTGYLKSDEDDLEKFTATYFPDDISSRQDNLGLTIKVLKAIAADATWQRVKDHSFIAGGELNVEESSNESNQEFAVNRVYGLIKISVNNRIGHMIIDIQNFVAPVPVVMSDNGDLKITEEGKEVLIAGPEKKYVSLGSFAKFKMVKRNDEDFIHVVHYEVETKDNITNEIIEKEEDIYTNKSLCSIVQAQNNFVIATKERLIAKISPIESTLKAFILVNLRGTDSLFTVGYIDSESKDVSAVFNRLENINADDQESLEKRKTFNRVCEILKIEGQDLVSLVIEMSVMQTLKKSENA